MSLDPGTRVVCGAPVPARTRAWPAGTVAVVVQHLVDQGGFRVRLPDGFEATLPAAELTPLSAAKALPQPDLDPAELRDWVVLQVISGSRAFGLDNQDSDTDRRAVFLPPAERHWSLFGVPDHCDDQPRETFFWELQRFCVLAAKANPNVLECLWSPLVEVCTEPVGRDLLATRDAFLSKLVHQTFNGYVASQFKKMGARRARGEAPKIKHAMHLIRLLHAGCSVLQTGDVLVDVGQHRDELLAIRDGSMGWDELERRRLQLHEEFDRAYASTRLPDRPDYARIDAFLIAARRSQVRD